MKAGKRTAAAVLSLALCFVSGFFCTSYAAGFRDLTDRSGEAARWLANHRTTYEEDRIPLAYVDSELPEKFDLRDRGVVTPVKMQDPFAACWGFAAIAASETSILSAMGTTYEETGLDLSEHHLAYFARTPLPGDCMQAGEGNHVVEGDPMDTGGLFSTATSLLSSGVGPVYEEYIPYRGRKSKTDTDGIFNLNYSAEDDWTIPEEYRFVQSFRLSGTEILPDPSIYLPGTDMEDFFEREKGYIGYDASATEEIKQAIYDGYAVYVAFCADDFIAGYDDSEFARYINTENGEWAHYTYDGGVVNHAVTIVGWDDSYSAGNFLDHSEDYYGDGDPHRPEGDGAWIVKNSWGAGEESFPNEYDWGFAGENGLSTGYFMLSYYDRSATDFEILDYEVSENITDYFIEEHDYMPAEEYELWLDTAPIAMKNVFTASEDGLLSSVAYTGMVPDAEVSYRIYRSGDTEEPVFESTEHYDRAGYHRLFMEEPLTLRKGEEYAVEVVEKVKQFGKTFYTCYLKKGLNEEFVLNYNFEQARCSYPYEPEYTCPDYWKGVVNPGESFLYLSSVGEYADLAGVISELQKKEDYADYDFDNFSIKAYFEYSSPEAAESAGDLPDLRYAPPAGALSPEMLYVYMVIFLFIGSFIAGIVLWIVFGVKRRKRINRKLKDYERQVYLLERSWNQTGEQLKAARRQLAASEAEIAAYRKEMAGTEDTENESTEQENG